ncbi:MAG: hypothetical protein LW875_11395 [Proteobacteria bacterium]|jgi:hypothetical protein|nr:hypothetical protein [Pseudomonadota bacterium]
MKTMVTLLILTASVAMANPPQLSTSKTQEFEAVCRIKAKEVAADTYRSCVTENRNAEIERLRKEYQDQLKALKSKYENEIKSLSSQVKKQNAETGMKPAETSPKAKTVKKSAKPRANSEIAVKSDSSEMSITQELRDSEMNVELRPAAQASPADESTMDLPEPVPVEISQ